ncbi:hypothetical protein PMAYCL1PPCAC_33523 [Pristionchus mayeri]|uniref:Uncharacterized protein n=1 Tax=Pristionchus mayeri TaxID=1317129 RepID=A0AAN5IED0_9BILA|nr:hypothetical protein PMAYCL1PPCAC_01521 [Pristionchus mayeri]GMR63328.1 hypothetical protein PMAYCL1PPCAC_33523 [Pristionchus mayeri]
MRRLGLRLQPLLGVRVALLHSKQPAFFAATPALFLVKQSYLSKNTCTRRTLSLPVRSATTNAMVLMR